MLYEDEELLGRRLLWRHKKKRKPVLKVNVRIDMKDKMVRKRFATFILLPFVCVAIVIIAWYVFSIAGKVLFTGNSLFSLRSLEIVVDPKAEITPQLIREYAKVKPGVNIFAVPVKEIRAEFLRDMPNIKTIEIRRQLPDTLRIRVIEREPIARLGRTGGLVVDNDGFVFVKKTELDRLPVVYGHKGARLSPGGQVKGFTYAAVQVLDACNDPAFEIIDIASVDVSGREDITLWLAGNKVAVMSWNKMGEDTEVPRRELFLKLGKLSQALDSDDGRAKSKFDLTYDEDVYAE